jgi:capsular polysaccharide transport system permease protein
MLGIIKPGERVQGKPDSRFGQFLKDVWTTYRHFLTFVVLPTLIFAGYYYGVASDQYEASADFVVKRADSSAKSGDFGQLLGLGLGTSTTASEAYVVSDYLLSHDTVDRLRRDDALVERLRRPGVDLLSRLWSANPTPEALLKFYRKQVDIIQDSQTGISHLTVHAFNPEDAESISKNLLQLGEERVNALNERSYTDQVEHSKQELTKAELALAQAEASLTSFRRQHQDIDPVGSGQAQVTMVTTLTGNLTAARAKLQAMQGVVSHDSPQYRAMERQVQALEGQIAGQSQRIAGNGSSIASSLGAYENLTVQREIAAKSLAVASAQYETARAEAQRKQIYLVRVVDVNRPVKSLYPERGRMVLTFFLFLALAYGIGSLLVAGIREHHI